MPIHSAAQATVALFHPPSVSGPRKKSASSPSAIFLKIRGAAIGRPHRLPRLAVRIAHHPPGFILWPRSAAAAFNRNCQLHQSIGLHHAITVAKRALLIVFQPVQARGFVADRAPPGQGREGAKGQQVYFTGHFTDLNIRSQRMPDSPCCAVFILLNQVKEARPTT